MRALLYHPMLNDIVTTVSLQYGVVVAIVASVLTIMRSDGTSYLASTECVIRVTRGEDVYAIRRLRKASVMMPYDTSFAQREYMQYLANRIPHDRS